MILLLGGTSDTAPLAARLADAGWSVLVSTASTMPLEIGCHPLIRRRSGPLDSGGLAALARECGARIIVDATHPYATAVRANARDAAEELRCPYVTYVRPPGIPHNADVIRAADHVEAAAQAFAFGTPVLLTTGANTIAPYMAKSAATGLPLFVRVLPRNESLAACNVAGVPQERVIAERGPFNLEENRRHIRISGAGVLVTKDGGAAAAVSDKLQAAHLENCRVIAVRRPAIVEENAFGSINAVVDRVRELLRCEAHDA